jgi:AbrB family looped-hinge helix DNA binding protein
MDLYGTGKKKYRVRLGRQGRVVIPAPLRRVLGLRQGDTLVCGTTGQRLILEARRTAEEELWQRFGGVKGSLAKGLMAQRRREAKREAKA